MSLYLYISVSWAIGERSEMGVKELEQSSLLLDEKLLRFMEQLELLEEKRAALNSLIEQVRHRML